MTPGWVTQKMPRERILNKYRLLFYYYKTVRLIYYISSELICCCLICGHYSFLWKLNPNICTLSESPVDSEVLTPCSSSVWTLKCFVLSNCFCGSAVSFPVMKLGSVTAVIVSKVFTGVPSSSFSPLPWRPRRLWRHEEGNWFLRKQKKSREEKKRQSMKERREME